MAYIKKNPRLAITVAVLLVLILGIVVWVLTSNLREHGRGAIGLRVYYYDADAGMLVGVPTTIAAGTTLAEINALLDGFYNSRSGLPSLWPADTRLVDLYFYGGTAGIALSAEHRDVPAFYEALFRTALTLTFLEHRFVEEVLFWIDGDGEKDVPFRTWLQYEDYRDNAAIRIETANTIDNNPSISPGVMREHNVTLYFVNAEGTGLITQTFTNEYVDIHRWVELTTDMLVANVDEDYAMRIIPSETRVRWVMRDTDARSVYVDLSGDFMSRFEGTPKQAGLMLQSIVNTLTLNDNNPDGAGALTQQVNQVFFLVDGNRYETFHGVLDFNLAFEYNHDIRLEGIYEPDPYYPYDPYYEEDVTVGPRGDDDE